MSCTGCLPRCVTADLAPWRPFLITSYGSLITGISSLAIPAEAIVAFCGALALSAALRLHVSRPLTAERRFNADLTPL